MASFRTSRTQKSYHNPWIWIDLESTGIDPHSSEILEISLVVTDDNFEPWDTLHIVLHHPMSVLLAKSTPWCKRKFSDKCYGGNGLFNENHFSTTSHEDCEFLLWNFFEFYSSHPVGKGRPERKTRMFFDKTSGSNGEGLRNHDISSTPYASRYNHKSILLAGSTVHFDREFLMVHFPCLRRFLNHKVIDVATFLETSKRFKPELLADKPVPSSTHRAQQDILDSIKLYKYFKEKLFDEKEATFPEKDEPRPHEEF